jgi:hypothetical protein
VAQHRHLPKASGDKVSHQVRNFFAWAKKARLDASMRITHQQPMAIRGFAWARTDSIEVPRPPVAELLGYSYNVTQRHAEIAAQPWARYVKAADAHHKH